MSEAPIAVEHVNHFYGEGELRRQVLFDVCAEIRAGEIVILTGPSGSGKTTLLTLMGALRSTQEGSLRVLGRELKGATEATLAEVRRRIGYVFQAHNLLESLSARQNVEMSVALLEHLEAGVPERRAAEALGAVGLGDRLDDHPSRLSGGQRQRVAIARALAGRPEILLADEPTASLDRETGRGVVELIQRLAKKEGVTVVLVTHDSRILDVADRILALEDGRLSSLLAAVTSDTDHMLRTLAQDIRKGELVRRVSGLDAAGFDRLVRQATVETQRLLEVVELVQGEAFESMLEQVVAAFTAKVAAILDADHAALLFLEEDADELWSFAPCDHGRLREVRGRVAGTLAGEAATSGRSLSVSGREGAQPLTLARDGLRKAESVLCVPVVDSQGRTFAVVELANKHGGKAFDADDERRLREFTSSLALILESWWRMSCSCRAGGVGRTPPCCGGPNAHHEQGSPQPAGPGS